MEQEIIKDDDSEYCVKIGKTLPTGCNVVFCEDIDKCPYLNKSDIIDDL